MRRAPREQRSHQHIPCSAEQTTHLQAGCGASGNGEACLAHTARNPSGRLGREAQSGPRWVLGQRADAVPRARELPDSRGLPVWSSGHYPPMHRAMVGCPAGLGACHLKQQSPVGKASGGAWDPRPEGRKRRSH